MDFVIIEGEESMPSPSAYELREREIDRQRERERERERERTYLNVEGIDIISQARKGRNEIKIKEIQPSSQFHTLPIGDDFGFFKIHF